VSNPEPALCVRIRQAFFNESAVGGLNRIVSTQFHPGGRSMRLLSELTIGLVETMEEMWRVSSPAFVMSTVVSLKDSISTSPKFRSLNEIDIRATALVVPETKSVSGVTVELFTRYI
jgi:hypothetical protein